MSSLWIEHKEVIQQLYVAQRRSLAEVKEKMENDYAFPNTLPISTYEVAIRDELGLFKKLKKGHWPLLYQLYLKGREKPFDLYLGETLLYEWPKVWKELRRSHKTAIVPGICLPAALVLRAPGSATSSSKYSLAARPICPRPRRRPPIVSCPRASSPAKSILMRNQVAVHMKGDHIFQSSAVSPLQSICSSTSFTASALQTTKFNAYLQPHEGPFHVFVKLQLERIPWNEVRLASLATLIGPENAYSRRTLGDVSYAVIPRDIFLSHLSDQLIARVSDSVFPSSWDLKGSQSSFMALTPGFNGYHFLNTVVYLLSNNLIQIYTETEKDIFNRLLDFLLHSIPKQVAYRFFDNSFLSIRAVWTLLLRKSYILGRTDVFQLLADICLNYHIDWISGVEDTILPFAARSGNLGVIQKLFELRVQENFPNGSFPSGSVPHSITEATIANCQACVRILAEACELNAKDETMDCSIFQCVLDELWIQIIRPELESGESTERTKSAYLTLEILLKAGANVDSPYSGPRILDEFIQLHGVLKIPQSELPSLLDISFHWDQELFQYLSLYSTRIKDRTLLTRDGVCTAAADGPCGVAEYLEGRNLSDTVGTKKFLELILLEQFFLGKAECRIRIKAGIARALFEYGVEISQVFRDEHGGANTLVHRVMHSVHGSEYTADEWFLLEYLLREISTISAETVMCAAIKGTQLLELVAVHGHDVVQHGVYALMAAVREGNVDSLAWFLEKGVDINAELRGRDGTSWTVLGAAIDRSWRSEEFVLRRYRLLAPNPNWSPPDLSASVAQRLVEAGAQLKLRPTDQSPYNLLKEVAAWDSYEEMRKAFEFFSSFHEEMAKISPKEWTSIAIEIFAGDGHYHYTGCLRCQLGEALVKKHCKSSYCAELLAAAIYGEASDDLVQTILNQTRDIDQMGIIPDTRMARAVSTPLQAAACRCNQPLVSQLLSRGADINAPARGWGGVTALQAVCRWDPISAQEKQRKSELIDFLLANGAKANDDADATEYQYTALQHCVIRGDLKHVALLLEHGADPNIPCPEARSGVIKSTLGLAVFYNRLDIAHLLLNVGAFSSCTGQTGYEGAIKYSNSTMGEMFQRHMDAQEMLFRQCPEMRSDHDSRVQRHQTRMDEYAQYSKKVYLSKGQPEERIRFEGT